MSIFKCKMCGGALEINNNETVATCEYCGTQQTLPRLDDDRKANLYDRANHFRRNNEFDKAMSIYEQILNEDSTDAEAYWSLVLCRYGIEYVEDPPLHKRIPTVNRAQFTSVFDDDNYKSALRYADDDQRSIYEEEAKVINEIQKGILAISQKEEPFDVFICYKESDNSGRRTPDSVLANDLYHQLTQEGFKVFFARITLEDKLGSAYEPYIFAALNSAKVMVVLGTKPEYFNAVWVKNEWSRYLALIKQGQKKMLIPAYKDMDPYDLPEEFSHLQAQDMSKLGFMQDLIRGIKKIAQINVATTNENILNSGNANINTTSNSEDKNFVDVLYYCEKTKIILDERIRQIDVNLMKLHKEEKEISQKKILSWADSKFFMDYRNAEKKVQYYPLKPKKPSKARERKDAFSVLSNVFMLLPVFPLLFVFFLFAGNLIFRGISFLKDGDIMGIAFFIPSTVVLLIIVYRKIIKKIVNNMRDMKKYKSDLLLYKEICKNIDEENIHISIENEQLLNSMKEQYEKWAKKETIKIEEQRKKTDIIITNKRNVLNKEKERVNVSLSKLKDLLNVLYSIEVNGVKHIHSNYRGFVPICIIYGYFDMGRCNSLKGYQGAYNLYEDEKSKGTIVEQSLFSINNVTMSFPQNTYRECEKQTGILKKNTESLIHKEVSTSEEILSDIALANESYYDGIDLKLDKINADYQI